MPRSRIANLPVRVAAGAFILNSGLTKLQADKETAERVHETASAAYPQFASVPPARFTKALASAEVALGAALLLPPVVGDAAAGLGLTAFAGGLLGLYVNIPGMRQEGSLRPSQGGIALAKDVWLAGIGLTLLSGSVGQRRTERLRRKAKGAHHSGD